MRLFRSAFRNLGRGLFLRHAGSSRLLHISSSTASHLVARGLLQCRARETIDREVVHAGARRERQEHDYWHHQGHR
jgi:hypothetical protein